MAKHGFRFFRAGGFDQVRLGTTEDLENLGELDPKLWVAISCPAKDLEIDDRTLGFLDADGDGRIRVPEVISAAKWIASVLDDPSEIFDAPKALPIESIDDDDADGKKLLASAKQILKNLGKSDAKEITAENVRDTTAIFAKTIFNGDGIVPPESAEGDEKTAAAIRDAMTCVGSDRDASGLQGLAREKYEKFFTEGAAYVAWLGRGEVDEAVMPLGKDTSAAFDAFEAIRAKIHDYFVRCALAAMDPRAASALNGSESELAALSPKDLSVAAVHLATLPIAHVEAGRALPLASGINPAFADAVAAFRSKCVAPVLGDRDSLNESDWKTLVAKFSAHGAWRAAKPNDTVERLGAARAREIVEGSAKSEIDKLLVKDEAVAPEARAIADVDKLVHLHRDFGTFLHNFVSFSDFYGQGEKAAFQAGTLFLDGRSFDLCLRVGDVAKHASLAPLSMICIVYCTCTRKGADPMNIAVAVTNGDAEFLVVGRNGVFYDRKGRDWDATVTRIVEQPISIRQAFWAPYKRLARFISEQVAKFAGDKDKASDDMLKEGANTVATATPAIPLAPSPSVTRAAAAPTAPAAFDVAKFAGVFAAIGLAVGAIGTAVAAVLTGFMGLKWWQMPLAMGGALLVVSGPSILLAAMKLRQRNLGPMLDASGWAVNARAMINIPFGAELTSLAALPPGSSRSLQDPYAERKRPWGTYAILFALVVVGCYLGRNEIRRFLFPRVRTIPVLRDLITEPPPVPGVSSHWDSPRRNFERTLGAARSTRLQRRG